MELENSEKSRSQGIGEEDEWQQVDLASSLIPPEGRVYATPEGSCRILPSRKELLSIVRKHSGAIGNAQGAYSSHCLEQNDQLDIHFWQQMMDMFFVRGLVETKAAKSGEDDDLIFFVRLEGVQLGNGRSNESDDSSVQPYFVRRWAPELEKVIGNSAWEVDWSRTFYLNLIAHTSFSLTISICSHESLQNLSQSSVGALTPLCKVTKTVYASASRTNFQPDSKATETVAAYPNICFVVDDYDDTFNDVVLTEPDHCYCVLLNAHGGAAFPHEDDDIVEHKRTSREARMMGEVPQGSHSPKVTLFSGFVNYQMVRHAFEGGKRTKFEDLFHVGPNTRSERLIMRGPGGRGEVEVAVGTVAGSHDSNEMSDPKPKPPLSPTKPGTKMALGTIMRRAAVVAQVVAKNVVAAASDGRHDNEEAIPLRCCLMALSLPWDILARDLLFKELPK